MTDAFRFRRLALALSGAEESSHMGAADFRVNGRIFATLAYVARGQATLKLTPDQQCAFLADLADFAEPAPGGWGRMGMTLLRLDAPEDVLRGALQLAHGNVVEKQAKGRAARPPAKTGDRTRLQ